MITALFVCISDAFLFPCSQVFESVGIVSNASNHSKSPYASKGKFGCESHGCLTERVHVLEHQIVNLEGSWSAPFVVKLCMAGFCQSLGVLCKGPGISKVHILLSS